MTLQKVGKTFVLKTYKSFHLQGNGGDVFFLMPLTKYN